MWILSPICEEQTISSTPKYFLRTTSIFTENSPSVIGTIKNSQEKEDLRCLKLPWKWLGDSSADIYNVISIEEEVYENFWKRFTGALDIGFDMSKTNNNRQFTFAGNLKYSSDKWTSKISFNALNSSQDDRDKIERKELSLSAQRFIKTLFVEIDLAYFSSTELGIKNRYNPGFWQRNVPIHKLSYLFAQLQFPIKYLDKEVINEI